MGLMGRGPPRFWPSRTGTHLRSRTEAHSGCPLPPVPPHCQGSRELENQVSKEGSQLQLTSAGTGLQRDNSLPKSNRGMGCEPPCPQSQPSRRPRMEKPGERGVGQKRRPHPG